MQVLFSKLAFKQEARNGPWGQSHERARDIGSLVFKKFFANGCQQALFKAMGQGLGKGLGRALGKGLGASPLPVSAYL
jgi:hypothetical protein